jgi:hypothetical protein
MFFCFDLFHTPTICLSCRRLLINFSGMFNLATRFVHLATPKAHMLALTFCESIKVGSL